MIRTASHRNSFCISCQHKGESCQSRDGLIAQLRQAFYNAKNAIFEVFKISGRGRTTVLEQPGKLCGSRIGRIPASVIIIGRSSGSIK